MKSQFFDHDRLQWTLRTGQLLQVVWCAVIAACGYLLFSSMNPYYTGLLLFVDSISMILIFLTSVVQKGLYQQKHKIWKSALIRSLLACCTPAFPFALMSLSELFNKETREQFMGTQTFYSNQKIQVSTKFMVWTLSSMLLLAGFLFLQFQKKAVFFDVAFSNPSYNLAPNLSVPELYSLGAECDYEGRTQCSLAAFLEILKQRPGEARALVNLAMAQSHVGEYKASSYNFEKAFKKGAAPAYESIFHYGKALFGQGKIQEAKLQFDKVIEMRPKESEAAAQMALAYIQEKNYKGALKFINSYTVKNPKAKKRFAILKKRLKKIITETDQL